MYVMYDVCYVCYVYINSCYIHFNILSRLIDSNLIVIRFVVVVYVSFFLFLSLSIIITMNNNNDNNNDINELETNLVCFSPPIFNFINFNAIHQHLLKYVKP